MKKDIKKNKKYNMETSNNVILNLPTVLLQALLTIGIIIFIIISYFKKGIYSSVLSILITLDLFVLAYNNHKIYKRKNFTVAYLAMGILMIFVSIYSFIN